MHQEELWKNKRTKIAPYITSNQKNTSKQMLGAYSKDPLLKELKIYILRHYVLTKLLWRLFKTL